VEVVRLRIRFSPCDPPVAQAMQGRMGLRLWRAFLPEIRCARLTLRGLYEETRDG